VASLSQGRTAAAQCGLFTYKSVPVIFEPPCIIDNKETALSFGRPLLVAECMSSEIKFYRALTTANHFLYLVNTERRTESKE